MIKQLILITLTLLAIENVKAQTGDLIIIGTVHEPMPNFNADSLLNILEKLNPDILLQEVDSSFLTKDFKYKSVWNENEVMATVRYVDKHPETLIRPFEFEGRNSYKSQRGISQAETPADKLLDSLFGTNELSRRHKKIVERYKKLTDSLVSLAHRSPYCLNNSRTDDLARQRQFYQHHKIRKIVNERKEFTERFVKTSNNELITLREGYNRICDFWDLRNKTMAKNIYKMMVLYPDKKMVVLTGFFHRYYLIEELRKLNKNINIVEFYNE